MKTLGWILLVTGAAGFGWAFKLQADQNAYSACCGYAHSSAPWVFGIGGAVVALVGLVLIVVGTDLAGRSGPGVTSGWYDDPTGMHAKRYHDGRRWTKQTIDDEPASPSEH